MAAASLAYRIEEARGGHKLFKPRATAQVAKPSVVQATRLPWPAQARRVPSGRGRGYVGDRNTSRSPGWQASTA